MIDTDIELLKGIANQLRIHSITSTTAAGSGHPTSCCSAADVMATLFFGHMRYDPKNPHYHNNDRFILSKGHAAPLLYAAWGETGLFPVSPPPPSRVWEFRAAGCPTARMACARMLARTPGSPPVTLMISPPRCPPASASPQPGIPISVTARAKPSGRKPASAARTSCSVRA